MTRPMWKPIGEASASFDANGLWIEQIDGFRVAVRRHFGMPPSGDNPFRPQQDLLDMETQNRVQREIIREAYRMNEERMGDRAYSEELWERAARLEDEANHERLRSQVLKRNRRAPSHP